MCAVLVKYLITRPSAALFLNQAFVLYLCTCVVLVNVCYAYERPSRQSSPGAAQSRPGTAHSNTATEQPRAAAALVERSRGNPHWKLGEIEETSKGILGKFKRHPFEF